MEITWIPYHGHGKFIQTKPLFMMYVGNAYVGGIYRHPEGGYVGKLDLPGVPVYKVKCTQLLELQLGMSEHVQAWWAKLNTPFGTSLVVYSEEKE